MDLSCKTVNWEEVHRKVKEEPWAEAVVEALKKGFENHIEAWKATPPLKPSDWSHHYFCKECGVRLDVDFHKPNEHSCPSCGRIYSGEPYDGAWRKMVHGAIVTNVERAAILANLYPREKKYGEYVKNTILYYAENYHKYEVHGKNAGKGKVFPQCLSEAIFVVSIERTLRFVSRLNLFSNDELELIGEKFFRQAAALLKPQIGQIHNIHAWMDAAVAACGYFLNDKYFLNFAIDGEYGWLNQVGQGVSEDGLWYEISPTYHFYTISALLSLAWVAAEAGRDLFSTPKFKKMATIPVEIAYENGEMPAYNDCWCGINISDYTDIYEQFSYIYNDCVFKNVLAECYSKNTTKGCLHLHSLPNPLPTPATIYPRNSVAALLFGSSIPSEHVSVRKQSRLFKSTGIGILENENIRVELKFNPHGGGHDHYDKLAIDVFAGGELISGDLGTSGYGIDITQKWNRTSAAHNLVVINGKRQQPCGAELVLWGENEVSIKTDTAYTGVSLKRTLKLEEMGFLDSFEVKCQEESMMDWIFHCKGEIVSDFPFEEAKSFYEVNGYDQIMDLKELITDKMWSVRWKMPNGILKLNFEGAEQTHVFMGRCFGRNGLERLGIVIVRRNAKSTCFQAKFEYMPY